MRDTTSTQGTEVVSAAAQIIGSVLEAIVMLLAGLPWLFAVGVRWYGATTEGSDAAFLAHIIVGFVGAFVIGRLVVRLAKRTPLGIPLLPVFVVAAIIAICHAWVR